MLCCILLMELRAACFAVEWGYFWRGIHHGMAEGSCNHAGLQPYEADMLAGIIGAWARSCLSGWQYEVNDHIMMYYL